MGPNQSITNRTLWVLLGAVALLVVLLGWTGPAQVVERLGYPALGAVLPWGFDNAIAPLFVGGVSMGLMLLFLVRRAAWFFGGPVVQIAAIVFVVTPAAWGLIASRYGLELLLNGVWAVSLLGLLFGYSERASRYFLYIGVYLTVLFFGVGQGIFPLVMAAVLRVFHDNGKRLPLSLVGNIGVVWLLGVASYYGYYGEEEWIASWRETGRARGASRGLLYVISYPFFFYLFYLSHLFKVFQKSRQRKGSKLYAWGLWFLVSSVFSVLFLEPFIALPSVLAISMAIYRDWINGYSKPVMRGMAMVHLTGIIVYILFLYLKLSSIDTLYGVLPGIGTGMVLLVGEAAFILGYEMVKRRWAFYLLSAFYFLFSIGYLFYFVV